MPSLESQTKSLKIRPIRHQDIPPSPKMSRGPSYDYYSYGMPGATATAARGNAVGGVASLLHSASNSLNEKAIDHRLKSWLAGEEPGITEKMKATGNQAFVASITYYVKDAFGSRYHMMGEIHLLDYASSQKDAIAKAAQYIESDKVNGSVYATPPDQSIRVFVYLVGEKTGN